MLRNSTYEHGADIYRNRVDYDFSSNVTLSSMDIRIQKAMEDYICQAHRYPDPYCNALRQAIAGKEGVDSRYIICGNGASELIYAFARAASADSLIIQPAFSEYEKTVRLWGNKVYEKVLAEENDFIMTESDCRDITERIQEGIGAVYLCNPCNPTGKLACKQYVEEIADCCKKNRTLLFIDECFMEMVEKNRRYSMMEHIMENEYIVVLRAFTKSHAMAGLRLGYCISSNENLLEKMCACMPCWNVSGVAQAAGTAAVKCSDYVENNNRIIAEEKRYLVEKITALGIKVFASDTNFLLIRHNVGLYEKLLDRGILIRKCDNFVGLDDTFYRLAVRPHNENEALTVALADILQNGD